MAKYKVCEKCGAALDHGESCDCNREENEDKGTEDKPARGAIREAVEAEVVIAPEKQRGEQYLPPEDQGLRRVGGSEWPGRTDQGVCQAGGNQRGGGTGPAGDRHDGAGHTERGV